MIRTFLKLPEKKSHCRLFVKLLFIGKQINKINIVHGLTHQSNVETFAKYIKISLNVA